MDGVLSSEDAPITVKDEPCVHSHQLRTVSQGSIVLRDAQSCSVNQMDEALCMDDRDLPVTSSSVTSQSSDVFPHSALPDINKEDHLKCTDQKVSTGNMVFEDAGSCTVQLPDKARSFGNGDLHLQGPSSPVASHSSELFPQSVLPDIKKEDPLKHTNQIISPGNMVGMDIASGSQEEKKPGKRQSSRKRKQPKTYRSPEYCMDLKEGESTNALEFDNINLHIESHDLQHDGNASIRNCTFSIQSTQKQPCPQLPTEHEGGWSSCSTLPQTSGLLNSCNTPPMCSPGQQEIVEKKAEQRYHCDQCQIVSRAKNNFMVHLATKHIFVKQPALSNTQPPDTNPPTPESNLDLPTTQVHAKDLGVNPSNKKDKSTESSSLNKKVASVDHESVVQLSQLASKANTEVVGDDRSGGPTGTADSDMEPTEGCQTTQGTNFAQKCETEENKHSATVEEQPCRATGSGVKGEDINEREFKKLMKCIAESGSANVFWCDICKTTSSIRDIVTHIASHTVLREPKCDVCGKVFMYFSSLRHHAPLHTGEKKYKCDTCERSFLQPASLKAHMVSHSDEKPHKCEVCGNGFKSKKTLIIHMRVHTGEEPFKCPQCSKGFKQYCTLKDHLRAHSGERPFICGECGCSFAVKKTLQNHKLLHSNEKTHKCKLCPKVFKQRAGLSCHMKTHTDEKPFHCTECGKFFKFANSLKNHQRLHSSEKPYICMQCPEAFKQRAGLANHMKDWSRSMRNNQSIINLKTYISEEKVCGTETSNSLPIPNSIFLHCIAECCRAGPNRLVHNLTF